MSKSRQSRSARVERVSVPFVANSETVASIETRDAGGAARRLRLLTRGLATRSRRLVRDHRDWLATCRDRRPRPMACQKRHAMGKDHSLVGPRHGGSGSRGHSRWREQHDAYRNHRCGICHPLVRAGFTLARANKPAPRPPASLNSATTRVALIETGHSFDAPLNSPDGTAYTSLPRPSDQSSRSSRTRSSSPSDPPKRTQSADALRHA
jgi:hypothetical protein